MTKQLQHFVPKFVLRRFGDNAGMIHILDKHTGNQFSLSTSKKAALGVAAERGMYDFDFSGAPVTIEPSLAELESDAAVVLDKVIRSENLSELDVVERGVIARFLAVQLVRTRATWVTHMEIGQRMEAYLRKEGMPEEFFSPDPLVGDGENAEKAMRAKMITNAPADYGLLIAEKDWVLLKTNLESPYLLGDDPFTRHNDFDSSIRGNLGLKSPGIQLYFPLTPTLSLGLWCPSFRQELLEFSKRLESLSIDSPKLVQSHIDSWKRTLDIIEAVQNGTPLVGAAENVEHFNSLQIVSAERFVFSTCGDFSLAEDMIGENPELRHGPRLEEATGKF